MLQLVIKDIAKNVKNGTPIELAGSRYEVL